MGSTAPLVPSIQSTESGHQLRPSLFKGQSYGSIIDYSEPSPEVQSMLHLTLNVSNYALFRSGQK